VGVEGRVDSVGEAGSEGREGGVCSDVDVTEAGDVQPQRPSRQQNAAKVAAVCRKYRGIENITRTSEMLW